MGFLGKIQSGLSKTRGQVSQQVKGALGEGKLNEDTLEDLEESLVTADVCYPVASAIIDKVRKACKGQLLSNEKFIQYLETFTGEYIAQPEPVAMESKPHVVLVLGVNGVGKTTSIAKLAHYYKSQGKKVLLAAGDTFRAGAIEQLNIWAERTGVGIVKHQEKSDAAAVIYDAYEAAKSRGYDILLADTAGRLHNKEHLMGELEKLVRVLKKHGEELPHESLLVVDGNTGQNAIAQGKAFHKISPLTGIVVTKLDGTAKGGAIITLNHEMKVPVRWIGVGEAMDDLVPFSKQEYVQSLFRETEIEIPLEQQEISDKFKRLQI